MQKPTIEYKTIIINEENIQAFRMLPGVRGQYISNNHKIIIYRYTIASNLILPQNDNAYKKIAEIKHKEPMVLAHEMQHAQNRMKSEPITTISNNIYEYIALRCMDEASAFTAGILSGQRIKTNNAVLQAAIDGTNEFLAKKEFYLTRFASVIMNDVVSFNSEKPTSSMIKRNGAKFFEQNFSTNFRATLSTYFTFNGYCLLNDSALHTTKEWQIFRNNVKEIKTACINRASAIANTIKQHNYFYGC